MVTHHIDYDKSNCNLKNLIPLCSSCNTRANFGRAKWQAYYTSLMNAFYAGFLLIRFIAVKKKGNGWEWEDF